MAAAAMHMRGPRLIRHVYSRSFLTVRTALLLTRQEKEKEREREREREGPHPRIKVPMFQAAHAITTCRWADWGVWLMCAPTRPKTTQPWEQHSGIRLSPPHCFSFGRASLHPALPWIDGWRAEPGGTMRCPQRTSGRE